MVSSDVGAAAQVAGSMQRVDDEVHDVAKQLPRLIASSSASVSSRISDCRLLLFRLCCEENCQKCIGEVGCVMAGGRQQQDVCPKSS